MLFIYLILCVITKGILIMVFIVMLKFIIILKRKTLYFYIIIQTICLFSSIYKTNDVSNVHERVSIYTMYKILKCLEVQLSVHPLTLFVSGRNKSKRFCIVYRSPYFGLWRGYRSCRHESYLWYLVHVRNGALDF